MKVPAKSNSELADLNRRTSPIQVGHFVEICLLPALDNLLALEQLVRPEPNKLQLRFSAHFPLVRSALESSALAAWVLGGESPREQIVRNLRARQSDILFSQGLTRSGTLMLGANTDVGREANKQAELLAAKHQGFMEVIARAEEVDRGEYKDGQPGYGKIINEATASHQLGGITGETAWRIISGFTHPSALRTVHYTKHLSIKEQGEGVLNVLSASNMTFLLAPLMLAVDTFANTVEKVAMMKIRPAAR